MIAPSAALQVLRTSFWSMLGIALIGWYACTQVFFPTQVKAVGWIACDEAHPDVFIVRRNVERSGPSRRGPDFVNELWCMADDGALEERSLFRGSLPLIPAYVLASAAGILVLDRRRLRSAEPDGG
jgi:hypothetical protein